MQSARGPAASGAAPMSKASQLGRMLRAQMPPVEGLIVDSSHEMQNVGSHFGSMLCQ